MREAIAYTVFDEAGLVASWTAPYEIFLDRGEGPTSLGIYTVIEVTDDTVIGRAFGNDDGNLYEAEGNAASLAAGTRDQLSGSYEKKNNENTSDWSDLEYLYDVLHSSVRTQDPAAWRSELEAIFDVDEFLEWLGLAAALQHWDTYGGMPHNFYLYHVPETGKLTWVSWDHNLILGSSIGGGGGGGAGGMGGRGDTSLDRQSVGTNWPLIRFLLDDPVLPRPLRRVPARERPPRQPRTLGTARTGRGGAERGGGVAHRNAAAARGSGR